MDYKHNFRKINTQNNSTNYGTCGIKENPSGMISNMPDGFLW